MKNQATRFLADCIEKRQMSAKVISKQLNIPEKKIIPGTRESLDAEEFLELCRYLHIKPEEIPLYKEICVGDRG